MRRLLRRWKGYRAVFKRYGFRNGLIGILIAGLVVDTLGKFVVAIVLNGSDTKYER